MKSLTSASLGLLLLLVGCSGPQVDGGTADPALKPGDLDLAITLDEEPRPVALTDAVERDLTLTLARKTSRGFTGTLWLGLPRELELEGKPQTFAFDLTKSKTATFETRLSVPEGIGRIRLTYPIKVTVGDKTYLTMDLIVLKAVAWKVIGPFEGGPDVAHDTAFPPEKEIDLAATYTGKHGRTVRWRPFPSEAIEENGRFDLDRAFGGADEATAYATLEVVAPREMQARLALGSDDSIKAWHNGRLVHDNNVLRGASPAQDLVDVTLVEGKNTFLLKVCEAGGAWGYYFELQDAEGNQLEGVQDSIALSRAYLTDPVLRLSEVTRNGTTLTWRSDVPNTATVTVRKAIQGRAVPYPGPMPKNDMVKADPTAKPIVVETDALTMSHAATVAGLEPGTRYIVTVDPATGGDPSEPLSFYTASTEGTTQVLHLKTVCVVCTNVADEEHADKEGADEPAPDELVERIKWEIAHTNRFYYVNSGMRFTLDVEYFVDDRFYAMPGKIWHGIAYSEHNEDEKLFHDVLAQHGKKLSDYDFTIMTCFLKYWDERGQKFHYGYGGGGTVGIQANTGLGKCGWRVGKDGNSGWLMCHEGQHQIDSLYHNSMGPEHMFCHFSRHLDTAYRFGGDYDGIGWILWEWAGYVTREHEWYPLLEPTLGFRYFTSRWGTVREYDDGDGDGIPDRAPNLPVDEERLGSDPMKTDTDGDGLSDMMEVMACRWVEYGSGISWAGESKSHYCDLCNPDTDGDGIKDGEDFYPIYPVNPKIRKASHATGTLGWDDLQQFVELKDKTYTGTFYLGWNDDYLAIGLKAPAMPSRMRFELDVEDDGWFTGPGNYVIRIVPGGGAGHGDDWRSNDEKTLVYGLWNCIKDDDWPFWDAAGFDDAELTLSQEEDESEYACLLHVPRSTRNGLDLVEGEQIGILLRVMPDGGIQRKWQYNELSVFEPHTLFTFELVR